MKKSAYVTAATQVSLIEEAEAPSPLQSPESPPKRSSDGKCSLCPAGGSPSEATIVCPMCSTQHSSAVPERPRPSAMCSLCSTPKPSVTQNNQLHGDCFWCKMWQAPFFPSEATQCVLCSILQGPNFIAPKKKAQNIQQATEVEAQSPNAGDTDQDAPVPDPVKRSPPTAVTAHSISSRSSPPGKDYIKSKMQTPLPPVPTYLETSSTKEAVVVTEFHQSTLSDPSTLDLPRSCPKVSNTAVFKGLQVATNGACDEDVNEWIFKVTGKDVRQFLVELSAVEGVGTNTLAGLARRAAKQKRQEARAWEKKRAE